MAHWTQVSDRCPLGYLFQVVIAGECYHHLLAKRVVRRWDNFVARKREERRLEAELMLKAKNFHERKMW